MPILARRLFASLSFLAVVTSATASKRPSAQDFLELVVRSKRGRLKLYIGFAAGVGKTWRMLEEAHALRRRGVDVVAALVETHGRAETAALIGDLEVVPRRKLEYRGVLIEELDLEAVLARAPAVAVVDEIPHTNVPGSKNRKRYQDVLDEGLTRLTDKGHRTSGEAGGGVMGADTEIPFGGAISIRLKKKRGKRSNGERYENNDPP